jgi:hypothetical protein
MKNLPQITGSEEDSPTDYTDLHRYGKFNKEQQQSVRICEICGRHQPDNEKELHRLLSTGGISHRLRVPRKILPQITQIYTDTESSIKNTNNL